MLARYTAERFYTDKSRYEIAGYREKCGGDEIPFSDPLWGMDAILLIRWPYSHYHSDKDNLEILNYGTIIETFEFVSSLVELINNNYTVKRNFEGPLQRNKLGWYLGDLITDLKLDKFTYLIDGKKSIFELALKCDMDLELCLRYVKDLISHRLVKVVH
jgi:aminopeptidase-like protein